MAILSGPNSPDEDTSELHAWLCDACIRGEHGRDEDMACECDCHEEPARAPLEVDSLLNGLLRLPVRRR